MSNQKKINEISKQIRIGLSNPDPHSMVNVIFLGIQKKRLEVEDYFNKNVTKLEDLKIKEETKCSANVGT